MNTQTSTAIATGVVPTADGVVAVTHNQPAKVEKLTDAAKESIAKVMDGLVTKLSSVVDDDVNSIVVAIEHSKKEAAAGPFKIMKWFQNTIDEATFALFPTPGTDWQTSEQPDKYEEMYFRDGKKRFKQTSFYLKFFLTSFPEGKRIATALAQIAIAKDENANQASVPDYIRTLDPIARECLREDLVSKQNSGVKSIRDAVAFMKQFAAVNGLAHVEAELLMDGDDDNANVQKVQKPIHVFNPKNAKKEWALYSISGFMQFDPSKAAELGGTLDALKLTAKREQGQGGGGGEADKPVVINTNATLAARLNDMAEFIANKLMNDPKRELLIQFIKDQVNGAGGDDVIYNLNEVKLFVDHVLNIPAIQTRLEIVSKVRDAA